MPVNLGRGPLDRGPLDPGPLRKGVLRPATLSDLTAKIEPRELYPSVQFRLLTVDPTLSKDRATPVQHMSHHVMFNENEFPEEFFRVQPICNMMPILIVIWFLLLLGAGVVLFAQTGMIKHVVPVMENSPVLILQLEEYMDPRTLVQFENSDAVLEKSIVVEAENINMNQQVEVQDLGSPSDSETFDSVQTDSNTGKKCDETIRHHMVNRSKCGIFKPKHPFVGFLSAELNAVLEPKAAVEAWNLPHLKAAIMDEFSALQRNNTWGQGVKRTC